MKKQCNLLLAVIGVTALILGGCSKNSSANTDTPLRLDVIPIDTQTETQDSTKDFDQNTTPDTQIETQDSTKNADQNTTSDNSDGEQADTDLDEQLARYRQEREDTIQEANGLIEGGSPDEKNYTFDLSGTKYSSQFDTREITEAYAAARIYVTDTLGITPNTKQVIYMCVDPRILSIYEDEDKGVAAGYENSNIFVCEYCDENNEWQYLILVRDSKGGSWNVIHNGNSYRE